MKKINLAFFILSFCSIAFCQTVSETLMEVTYGRKDGMALTMVVQKPLVPANHRAIIYVVSAGWTSDYNWIALFKGLMKPLSERGYTVFYVMHGSQPRYTVPDIVPDIKRAIRYIRYNAIEFDIDPDKIGIAGSSAGGHLSLIMGTSGDEVCPNPKDAIERVSCRVQAVACFFPPTDLLNYGSPGNNVAVHSHIKEFQAPFDFVEWNAKTLHYIPVTDTAARSKIGRSISPYYFITPDDAPTLIVHGDADTLVPLPQSEKFIAKLKEVNIPCQLIIKPGAGHGIWNDLSKYTVYFADWFDQYLR